MTTDPVRMDTNAAVALAGGSDSLARLGQWVEAARNAHQLVAPLVGTAFIPDAYKPKIDPRATPEQKAEARDVAIANATAAVLQGITLGLDPMTALQQIYVVHGRPGMYARIKVALVQAHGHEVWTEDLSDSRAVVCGRRRGTEGVERVTVTMDQARKAGWTSNQAYAKTPQDMLYARAAARVCDRIAADVLMGIASVEEIQDEIKVPAEVGKATRTVTPRRAAAAIEASEEPPLDPAPTAQPTDAEPAPAEASITGPQQKKMHALLNEKGLGQRDLGLGWIAQELGRDIESTKDLTKAEAGRVIEALEGLAEAKDADPALDGDDWPPAAQPGGQPELEQ